jgi:hypothetical protein
MEKREFTGCLGFGLILAGIVMFVMMHADKFITTLR